MFFRTQTPAHCYVRITLQEFAEQRLSSLKSEVGTSDQVEMRILGLRQKLEEADEENLVLVAETEELDREREMHNRNILKIEREIR